MISREEEERPMKRRMVLPAIALVLAGLWMISAGLGAEDLAELYVTKIVLDPPSAISRGEEVEIYARVMNTGARSADGFSISFFYRLQGSPGNWTLHETERSVSLPPSHQDFHEVTFHLDTSDLDLGTYELRVVADSSNHISEADELNNELLTTMTLVGSSLGLPDLQPTSLTYARSNPGSTDDMEPWSVVTQIRNLGEIQAGQFVVAFLVDGVEFARQIRFVLPARGVTDISAELDPQDPERVLSPGTHEVAVVIDPDDEVPEQNEGNNTLSGSLTLQSVELVPLSLAFDKSVVRLDEETRVTAEIRNDGEGAAKSIEVQFFAGHVRFASETIAILGRGMTATVEGILDPEKQGLVDAPAVYEIRVVVDPSDLLQESDEDNNEMTRTLTILPPELKKAELHPESIELTPPSPTEQHRADAVTVTSVIKNTGRADAQLFDVTFAYRIKGGLRWEALPCIDAASCAEIRLPSGAQQRLVGQLPVVALGPGIYEIRIFVDAGRQVDELDETNNELVTTLTLLASRSPDLALCSDGVTVEPVSSVQRGQTVRLTTCIANLGEQDAGPFEVRFSYCRASLSATGALMECSDAYEQGSFSPGPRISVPGLAIADSIEVSVLLETTDFRPGDYSLRVEIDPADAVRERNELNNSFAGIPLTVLGPDLAVIAVTPSPEGVVDQATTDRLDVAATILNAGVVATGEFTVRFRLMRVGEAGPVPVPVYLCGEAVPVTCESPDYACAQVLPGIGVLVPVQVRWALNLTESDLPAGQYVLKVEADCEGDINSDGICDGKIAEHNELNNALEVPLTVLARPADLVVAGPIGFPDGTPVDYGSVVPITASIANIGGSVAGGSCSTSPSCGIGVEFLVYETGEGASDTERLVRLTPLEEIAVLQPGEAADVTALLDTRVLDPAVTGYRICVRVDPDGSIVELDETNNEFCTPPQLELYPPPPDLRLASPPSGEPMIRFAPVPPIAYEDQPVVVHFTVLNDSRSRAQGFNVGFRIRQANVDGAEWVDVERKLAVAGLAPGQQLDLSQAILLPPGQEEQPDAQRGFVPPGVYEFCVLLDVDDFVDEIDEQNNVYCTTVGLIIEADEPVTPTPPCPDCPDLRIRSVSAHMIAGSPGQARICATIENAGPVDIFDTFTVRAYYVSAYSADPVLVVDPRHRTVFAGLASGDTASFRQEFDITSLGEGFYDVFVVVDQEGDVSESNEENNIKDESLWIH